MKKEHTAGQMGVAVLGCGHWGTNYVRVLGELPEVRLRVACDERADRLHEIARRFPTVALTTELDAALSHDGVDAVIVCTNATTHYTVTRCALMMGKHVLVEKPLTMESAEADDLIELAESQSAVLMVGHTFVYNAGIRKVKEYVQTGRDQVRSGSRCFADVARRRPVRGGDGLAVRALPSSGYDDGDDADGYHGKDEGRDQRTSPRPGAAPDRHRRDI